jgi:hypothetical protein
MSYFPDPMLDDQKRVDALSLATSLEARRLEKVKFTDKDDTEIDADTVVSNAKKFYEFLRTGEASAPVRPDSD